MRASMILNIYKFKVKAILGAFRASKASIALLLVYTFGFLPSVFGVSITINNMVKQGSSNMELFAEALSAVFSGFIAFSILLSLKGYTVFEYEQSFIFTSPIKPREFLIASILCDLSYSLLFANPIFILYAMLIFSLNLSAYSAALMLLSMLLFVFLLFFLKISLSIVKALHQKIWVNILMLSTIVLLMLPSLGFFVGLPLKYSLLPYPSTFLAEILVSIIYGVEVNLIDILGLTSFFLLSTTFFMLTSRKNFFPAATYVPFASPFDTSMRVQTLKMERSIKMFSRTSSILTLNLESRSLLSFLMRKEVIRMMREGSLFAVILLYAIVLFALTAISTSSSQSVQQPPIFFLIFFLGTYSLITPSMLVSNWRFSDLDSLWVPLTSGIDMRIIIKALLYDFILVSSAIPSLVIIGLSIIHGINPILPLTLIISTSMIGCSISLYIIVKFLGKTRRGTPSPFVGWTSMLISALLLTPIYVLVTVDSYLKLGDFMNILFSIMILFYSTLILKYFLNKTGKSINNVEL
ncbi:MAG: hypothetical protein QXK89_00775 [Candidatus Bathyarchaeia archaeon]